MKKKVARKQDRRTQIRLLRDQGCWDPAGAIKYVEQVIKKHRAKLK